MADTVPELVALLELVQQVAGRRAAGYREWAVRTEKTAELEALDRVKPDEGSPALPVRGQG